MELPDLLRHVVKILEDLELRYFVTGSVATIYFGEPRFTNDIDIVVDLPPTRVAELCQTFPEGDFYVSEESAARAVRAKSQFNIIHPSSGLKVDIMVPQDNLFNRGRFLRSRRLRPAPDFEVSFTSAEDAILMKMLYYQEGGSDKHIRDITGILKVGGDSLDLGYIGQWAAQMGLAEIWKDLSPKKLL